MRFNFDPKVTVHLARSRELENVMGDLAEETANEARRLAFARAFETGKFLASIEADSGQDEIGAMGRVNSHDPDAPYIEFGTSRMPAEAILRRALENTFGTEAVSLRRRR